MSETARDLGRRWFDEVWNQGRREAIAEMMAPAGIIHDGKTDSTGPEGFYPFFDRMNETFTQIRITVEDAIGEGDRACIRWSCSAKHTGTGLGLPPSGKTVQFSGMTLLWASGGKVVEAWQNWDMVGMMEQIQGPSAKAAMYIGAS